jgi:ring-1,2-phenylacetyl-CoA epoxidase subunit PaaC
MSDQSELIQPAPPSPLPADAYEALLALADDELIIGHRHSEWLGLSPFLEEDLTLSSIAQDEFGHARGLYALIWPGWGERLSGVTRRPATQWRSCALVEAIGQPWELSLVRHFLYDLAETFRWSGLVDQFASGVDGLFALAQTALAEERFHTRHATDLVLRLGNDTTGMTRLQPHLDSLAPLVGTLTNGMTAAGEAEFIELLNRTIAQTRLVSPFTSWQPKTPDTADRGVRSAPFDDIQAALLNVFSYDPSASW